MVDGKENLSIKSGVNNGVVVLGIGGGVSLGEAEIVKILLAAEDGDKIIKEYKNEKSVKEKGQYESLKPVGFEYAPASAKNYREKLEDTNNIEQMKHFQQLSYNQDNTVNIPELGTFCADLTGDKTRRNWNDANNLATSKGYRLMTTRNDSDTDAVKQKTDLYKLTQTFSEKYIAQGALVAMLGCDIDWYWTATPYKNEKGEDISGAACIVKLDGDYIYGDCRSTYDKYRVCGFKDSMD